MIKTDQQEGKSMIYRNAFVVASLLLISSCQQGVELIVLKNEAGPIIIRAQATARDFEPCIQTARIYAKKNYTNPLWELAYAQPPRCIQKISVGIPEPGFLQLSNKPIPADGSFCLEATGPGFSTRNQFTLEKGRIIEIRSNSSDC
ncbi:hypothetical protein ACSBM8_08960 [Sphingomonas sp. ASY06-1R]|uniref:hypothetical protein n=1 Tax=Sphingomonas sp. ASY06-1R TaxID=3445771 RepID=UPI003FA1B52A